MRDPGYGTSSLVIPEQVDCLALISLKYLAYLFPTAEGPSYAFTAERLHGESGHPGLGTNLRKLRFSADRPGAGT